LELPFYLSLFKLLLNLLFIRPIGTPRRPVIPSSRASVMLSSMFDDVRRIQPGKKICTFKE
jgi:hypothetical protein